ncbi:MAG: WD40/YVTN/BNR-like repeat-containing protein, partial [Longimicrobiales bacterium]
MLLIVWALALVTFASTPQLVSAQAPVPEGSIVHSPELYGGLAYRMVGPYRGGRSSAVAGTSADPATFFMGTTGGGMWKTDDYGVSWNPISDDFFGGSVGAVDVADSDPNVVYAGLGSVDVRGNTSAGRGAWRSTDAGKTWTHVGLADAGQIGRIEIHPNDPDLVYVAAMGHAFGKNDTRGVYRSRDGGVSWENVLFLNDSTGAVDLSMNPNNPRELYAGMWRGERKPWAMISGGEEGGVYKSNDAGDSWEKLSGGLPEGLVGKVGVSVSPANPDRVWAILEAEPDGGVYRSDDAGATWTRVNSENNLRQRAWYYTHVQADPQDENTVYALNTSIYRSVDGGKTFEVIPVPHGDLHDLWINPEDPEVMIVGDDGGGQVSVNGGKSWSTYHNQPTAELYDVIVDNGFPYRLYGAQQDNTTMSVPVWMGANVMHPKEAWLNVGGCETGPVALHPDHPDIVYAGCYGGVIDRYDLARDQVRNINLYPQLQLGSATSDLRYRFQWVSPMVVSPHDPDVLYHGSQYVLRTRDGGMTWETLSADLTTDNPDHQDQSGGPINADVTGVEIYNVVFSIAVSPHTPEVVWAGTDDGRVWITRDEGSTWTEITPPDMPELGTVDEIDASVHAPGRAVMAVQRYRLDDFEPYVFITNDYGETWERLADGLNGIPPDYPVRTVREDPVRQGLLFAGTEFGLYTSFDDGANWQSLQLNLPITPVTGMRVAHDDLIISTQGRSFWILDDMTPLRELTEEVAVTDAHLFQPRDAYRVTKGSPGALGELGPRVGPNGALLHYYLSESDQTEGEMPALTIEVRDGAGGV